MFTDAPPAWQLSESSSFRDHPSDSIARTISSQVDEMAQEVKSLATKFDPQSPYDGRSNRVSSLGEGPLWSQASAQHLLGKLHL